MTPTPPRRLVVVVRVVVATAWAAAVTLTVVGLSLRHPLVSLPLRVDLPAHQALELAFIGAAAAAAAGLALALTRARDAALAGTVSPVAVIAALFADPDGVLPLLTWGALLMAAPLVALSPFMERLQRLLRPSSAWSHPAPATSSPPRRPRRASQDDEGDVFDQVLRDTADEPSLDLEGGHPSPAAPTAAAATTRPQAVTPTDRDAPLSPTTQDPAPYPSEGDLVEDLVGLDDLEGAGGDEPSPAPDHRGDPLPAVEEAVDVEDDELLHDSELIEDDPLVYLQRDLEAAFSPADVPDELDEAAEAHGPPDRGDDIDDILLEDSPGPSPETPTEALPPLVPAATLLSDAYRVDAAVLSTPPPTPAAPPPSTPPTSDADGQARTPERAPASSGRRRRGRRRRRRDPLEQVAATAGMRVDGEVDTRPEWASRRR